MQNAPALPVCVVSRYAANPDTTRLIQHIRASPPSRLVEDGRSNVAGRYPSLKMGHTIQFESHKVELPFIREYEFDSNVLEYYDQPDPIKIFYLTSNGRPTTALTTPDFFVIRDDGTAGWEECKPEQDLERLAEKSERFVRDENGAWRCPPGEAYAAKYGLYFRVRSSAEINWVWQRNIEYLSDYLQAPTHPIDPDTESFIKALVSCKQGILLSELIENAERYSSDDILQLIARNELYVNLYAHPLSEQDRVPVYTSQKCATISTLDIPTLDTSAVTVAPGAMVAWDGKLFQIVNSGDGNIWMQSEQGSITPLEYAKFNELVRIGAIRNGAGGTSGKTAEICRLLQNKSPSTYEDATLRYQQIVAFLAGSAGQKPTRTQRRWMRRYREAEALYGHGYIGLLDNKADRGNRLPKLPARTYELMAISIKEHHLNSTLTSPITVYGHYRNQCERTDVIAASFRTFTGYLNRLDARDTEFCRKGARAAYQLDTFYWELELTTPRHGERPFEIAHIDHTELDIELVDSLTGSNLGRPWLTLMVCANSRKILAYIVSFEPPSYRSCMMVMRECVCVHGRLPQNIVVDRGAEFKSIYFEQLLAMHTIIKKNRPGAKPRFGAVLERLFGMTNQRFIHALSGNTQIMRNVRQVTKSVNPATLAVWTFQRLNERLGQYFTEVYHNLDHPALGETPQSAFERGLAKHGLRPMKFIRYDEAFLLSTLPSTPKGLAKVIRSRGIKINNFYYWHESLRLAAGMDVYVRYDPYDIGTAYAFVKGQWFCCHSQHYALLRGRSEKEVELISQEIWKRRSNHNGKLAINAQKVAAFIAESKGVELELKGQRKAAEMRTARGDTTQALIPEKPAQQPPQPILIEDFEIYDELKL